MEESKKLFEIISKFISSSSENDLKKLIEGDYKLSFSNLKEDKDKPKKSSKKNNKTKKVVNKVEVDTKEIEDIYESIKVCSNRESAKNILLESKFTNAKLIELGKFIEVNIPKSYNKEKIIEKIIEVIIGGTLDKESISKVKLK